jgi:hypothetical protein
MADTAFSTALLHMEQVMPPMAMSTTATPSLLVHVLVDDTSSMPLRDGSAIVVVRMQV